MTWLFPAVVSTLMATVLLGAAYGYLYYVYRRRFLALWFAAWSVYSLRYIFLLLILAFGKSPALYFANLSMIILSLYFLYRGTAEFIEKEVSLPWEVAFVALLAWTALAVFGGFSFLMLTVPLFGFFACVDIWVGYNFLRSRFPAGAGKALVGITFIVWGLHQADYPLLRPVSWFAPFGYMIGTTCGIIIALGMLILFFERMRADLAKKKSQLRQLFNEASYGIALADPETGTIVDCNSVFADLIKKDKAEIIGRPQQELHPCEEHIGNLSRTFKQHLGEDNGQTLESKLVTASGKIIDVEIKANLVALEDKQYLQGFFKDISERKQVEEERRKLEKQLQQKYKMEAVGLMAGGIAHNFNNNLAIILVSLELAKLKLPKDSKASELIGNAHIAALRGRDLVQQIMTFSRQNVQGKIPVRLALVVDETLKLIGSTIPATVELRCLVPAECLNLTINGDSTRLQEALINLCNNATYSMGQKGVLTIALDTVALEPPDIPVQYLCSPGSYARLSVQDTGCGMDEETVGKIFDPFFTTKDIGEGTGMGLSTVHGIVEQHDGLVKIQTALGQGARFELYFPLIDPEQSAHLSINHELSRGTEKILLVDDDELLAQAGQTLLSEMGYQVTTETCSVQALESFSHDPGRFDLVITDQMMSRLTGKEFTRELRKLRPDLPVILCTGYCSAISKEEAETLGISAFVMKPFEMPKLLQIVRNVLDEERELIFGVET